MRATIVVGLLITDGPARVLVKVGFDLLSKGKVQFRNPVSGL